MHCIGSEGSHPKSSLIFIGQWLFSKLKEKGLVIGKPKQANHFVCSQVIQCGDLFWLGWAAKRKPENGEMWFSCKSRPQRCIFQHKDIFPDRRDVFSNYAPLSFHTPPWRQPPLQLGLLVRARSRKTEMKIREQKFAREKGIGLFLTTQHL